LPKQVSLFDKQREPIKFGADTLVREKSGIYKWAEDSVEISTVIPGSHQNQLPILEYFTETSFIFNTLRTTRGKKEATRDRLRTLTTMRSGLYL